MSKGLNEFVYSQLDELEALFKKKHEQYSSGADELANFRRGALLNGRTDDAEGMFEELKAYMAKHIAFVYTHDIHGDTIAESLKDIAVYSLIALYMRELTTIKSTKLDSSSVHVAEVHDGTQCADRKTWDLLRDIYTPSDAEQKLHHQISETLFRLAGELAEEERRRNE